MGGRSGDITYFLQPLLLVDLSHVSRPVGRRTRSSRCGNPTFVVERASFPRPPSHLGGPPSESRAPK